MTKPIEYDRIVKAFTAILDRAEIKPAMGTTKMSDSETPFSEGIPGIRISAKYESFIWRNPGSEKIANKLERVAHQINQQVGFGDDCVVKAVSHYDSEDLAGAREPHIQPKNTLIVDAGYFSSPQNLQKLEEMAKDFTLKTTPMMLQLHKREKVLRVDHHTR